VLRVVSGKERKVKEYLDKEISRSGWSEIIKQVFLPVEKVYKVQNGKKVMRERNYYPGYVMIEILEGKLGDDIRETIKNTSNVIHFLGKENPIALRKAEVNKMLGKMDEMAEAGGVSMIEPLMVSLKM
jgi:transcriptional antiterminator NusG